MSIAKEKLPRSTSESLPVISLFSGAGGLDIGVSDVGGDIRVCVEPDRDAAATLRLNQHWHPNAEVLDFPIEFTSSGKILEAARLKKGEAALVVGGPPCTPFSKAGYWLWDKREGASDGRAAYIGEYLRVLRDARPQGFILENVPSLLHPGQAELAEWFLWRAKRLGYSTSYKVLHAAEYGVPQSRARLFIIGLRGKEAPTFPSATHWWHGAPRADLRDPETAGRWIAHLDRPEFREREEVLGDRWRDELIEIPPGQNYKYHTAWAGHPRPRFVTETKYWSFLLKLSPYRPSWTLQASAGPWTGPFHWTARRLRVPEFAALQTFPANYRLAGSRRGALRQIGNAVPCVLASHVAAEILRPILGRKPRRRRLLKFEFSEGFAFDHSLLAHKGHRW